MAKKNLDTDPIGQLLKMEMINSRSQVLQRTFLRIHISSVIFWFHSALCSSWTWCTYHCMPHNQLASFHTASANPTQSL